MGHVKMNLKVNGEYVKTRKFSNCIKRQALKKISPKKVEVYWSFLAKDRIIGKNGAGECSTRKTTTWKTEIVLGR